jgi:hypothetical protein
VLRKSIARGLTMNSIGIEYDDHGQIVKSAAFKTIKALYNTEIKGLYENVNRRFIREYE